MKKQQEIKKGKRKNRWIRCEGMERALCEVGVEVIYNIKYNIQMEDIGLTDREVELWGEIGE